jgi:N-acetylmuramoyl-L-alanine amidase
MGSLYLTELADLLYSSGLNIIEYGGWQTRSRGSGGYDDWPLCVMWHHTASPASWDGQKDADYCAVGDDDSPLANLYIDRSGTVWVLAAGATNTNGSGNSMTFSRGTVPQDSMNTRALGVEMGNDGIGELWPQPQIDSMFVVSNVCNGWFGNRPDDLSTHNFYAPTRKIDPATTNVDGPWQPSSCNSSGSWDVDSVRNEAMNRAGSLPQPPEPHPPSGNDWWKSLMDSLPVLHEGDSGEFVLRMQHLMCSVGAMNETNPANYDGVFGSGTANALAQWKASIGGTYDSVCDSWTWGALMHTIDGIPTIRMGDSGDDVKRMQHLLSAAGFMNPSNLSNFDGVWGGGTDGAKMNFDLAHGLASADTSCGEKSWTSLLNGKNW